MAVQTFNPAEVGGQPLKPSPKALTPTTIAWLKKVGWGKQLDAHAAKHHLSIQSLKTATIPSIKPSTKPVNTVQSATAPPVTMTPITFSRLSSSNANVPLPPVTPFLAQHPVYEADPLVPTPSQPAHSRGFHVSATTLMLVGFTLFIVALGIFGPRLTGGDR
jgi:hypothetical protein